MKRAEIVRAMPDCEYSDDGRNWFPWDWRVGLREMARSGRKRKRDEVVTMAVREALLSGALIRLYRDHGQRVRMIGSTDYRLADAVHFLDIRKQVWERLEQSEIAE